jgi:hypothetical protein
LVEVAILDDQLDRSAFRSNLAMQINRLNNQRLTSRVLQLVLKKKLSEHSQLGRLFVVELLLGTTNLSKDDGLDEQSLLLNWSKSSDLSLRLASVDAWLKSQSDEALNDFLLCEHLPFREVQSYNLLLLEIGRRPGMRHESFSRVLLQKLLDPVTHWSTRLLAFELLRTYWPEVLAAENGEELHQNSNQFLQHCFEHAASTSGGWSGKPEQSSTRAPQPKFFARPLPAKHLVFLLDESASMQLPMLRGDQSTTPWKLMRQQLQKYLSELQDDPEFAGIEDLTVILFADSQRLFKLIKGGKWNVNEQHSLNQALNTPRGVSTNLYDALRVAFSDSNIDSIVLFSDAPLFEGGHYTQDYFVREVERWNLGRGTRIDSLAPRVNGPTLGKRLAASSHGEDIEF